MIPFQKNQVLATVLGSLALLANALPVEAQSRPNPARFYMKIGEKADFWPTSTDETKNKVALYNDLIFIWDTLPGNAKAIADDLRARRETVANPELILLRYWNMWVAYNAGTEAAYTEDMYVFQNWPEIDPATRGKQLVADLRCCPPCTPDLVDISRSSLKEEMARVINSFLNDYDGVYFDNSVWDVYKFYYDIKRTRMKNDSTCDPPPFDSSTPFVADFLPASLDFAVGYHQWVQTVIDPVGNNSKLHLCNMLPRYVKDQNPFYEEQYLSILDGCQVDGAFMDPSGRPFTTADWLFQIETMQRLAAGQKYFLTKVPWNFFSAPQDSDALEYGFSSYLLGTDGKFALFMPAWNFTEWDTNPITFAQLGSFLGNYQLVPGSGSTSYIYVREFETGIVYVNANTVERTVTLPQGTYRDVRRGTTLAGTITIPKSSGRILTRVSGENPSSDLAVTMASAPDPVRVGSDITYTIIVDNHGPTAAPLVTVTDNLPSATSFQICTATGGGVCGGSGNNRTITFPSLGLGESATITLSARVNMTVRDRSLITNTALAGSSGVDPNLDNNAATDTVRASNPFANLAITKAASPANVQVGTKITYTIAVTNNGPAKANDVVVTDTLPAATKFISCTSSGTGICDGSGQIRTIRFPTIGSTVKRTITLVAQVRPSVSDGRLIRNTARVSTSSEDPDFIDNRSTATVRASSSEAPQ